MYELYVVRVMQEQKLGTSDESMPTCKVEKHNSTQNRIRFKNVIASIGDEVVILPSEQHQQLIEKGNDADKYIAKINQLEFEINNADIRTLKKDNEDLQKQIKNKNNSINTFKTNSVKNKATIEDLQDKLTKYKKTIAERDATITSLTGENKQLKLSLGEQSKTISSNDSTIEDLQKTIQQHQETISNLKEMNDNIAKQLEDSIDASELDKLEQENNDLKEYKTKYEKLIGDYTKVCDENIGILEDNRQLKDANQFLNENIGALRKTFDKAIEDNSIDAENKEKELKETIKNQQLHIDELTDKYQSLLPIKDNIPQSTHYSEIDALKDKLNDATNELNKTKADIETKLAVQKQEINDAHKDEIHQLKETHTNEKAQLLVAYNNDLNNSKLKYNELAMEYNSLIDELYTITKWNALIDSRHEKIRKDKEYAQLLEIPSEQLPSDKETIEFIPKD